MEDVPRGLRFSWSIADYMARLGTVSLRRKPTHYDYLELGPNCSASDIRKAYYHFARICHPDKCQDPTAQSMLYNLQVAYDLLSDEYKRILYDLKNGFRSPEQLSESLSNLSGLLQRRYQDFLNDRNDAYVASVMREYDRSGLVIKKALYGDLTLTNPEGITAMETIGTKHIRGPYIDVTVQLQVLIEHGVLHINSGDHMSFAFLPGFYNPLDFTSRKHEPGYEDETQLYILYLFKGDVHEVTICDGETLKLPMRSHRVYGSYIKGPYTIANLETLGSA